MKKLWIGATLAAITLVCARPAAAQIGIVSVTGGRVEGVTADGVTSFKGIPFAAPPVGKLRWQAPQRVRPWRGIRRTDHFAPGCMQAPNRRAMSGTLPVMSEDCLYLNVWTPATSAHARLPVMVWIYGGGFSGGMTSYPLYEGAHLAQKGVVVVSLAYRLGVFGFLADPELSAESAHHTSGTYGLLDMIAGLKWVKRNIAKFGGDPSRVTIFGESAGGGAVGILAQSALAKGLFERAIAESGSNFQMSGPIMPPAQAAGARFLAELGAKDIKAARALSARVLLEAQQGPASAALRGIGLMDGYILRGDGHSLYRAHQFNDTPVLVGTNSDEGGLFVPAHTTPDRFKAQVRAQFGAFAPEVLAAYPHATEEQSSQAARDIVRDAQLAWGAWTWVRLQSQYGNGKAYLYYFDVRTPRDPHGSPHTAEVGYVFDNLGAPSPLGAPPATDPSLAATISHY